MKWLHENDDGESAKSEATKVTLTASYHFWYINSVSSKLNSVPVQFWASRGGNEPVREFLKDLPQADRRRIGEDLRRLQFGWPIGMPLVRKLEGELWELRSSLPSRREVRLIFATDGALFVLLHGFVKKTQKTPAKELELARQRLKEMTS